MATLSSYELKGKKLSFANWISNLSPIDTPFVSMSGKEAVDQTKFYWQSDRYAAPAVHAVVEGSDADDGHFAKATGATTVNENVTQILRKVVSVSDTANSLANYGRGRELAYQMEKAGKALKRDLEKTLLSAQKKADGDTSTARNTACFAELVSSTADTSTGASVKFASTGTSIAESDIFKMTYNLYLAGSKANIIMFHPKHAAMFAGLVEDNLTGNRTRLFDGGDTKLVHYVNTVVDPLGQEYKLVPNRFMPEGSIFFFNPSDWTQMVLRAPTRIELAKEGSAETWMIEMEVGLRHRNPFASGVLTVKA